MKISALATSITLALLLSACSLDGDDGKEGDGSVMGCSVFWCFKCPFVAQIEGDPS